jgi:hypothetical protein
VRGERLVGEWPAILRGMRRLLRLQGRPRHGNGAPLLICLGILDTDRKYITVLYVLKVRSDGR